MYDDNLRTEDYYLTLKYNRNYELSDCDTRLTKAKQKRLDRLTKLERMAWDGRKGNDPAATRKNIKKRKPSFFPFACRFAEPF